MSLKRDIGCTSIVLIFQNINILKNVKIYKCKTIKNVHGPIKLRIVRLDSELLLILIKVYTIITSSFQQHRKAQHTLHNADTFLFIAATTFYL